MYIVLNYTSVRFVVSVTVKRVSVLRFADFNRARRTYILCRGCIVVHNETIATTLLYTV